MGTSRLCALAVAVVLGCEHGGPFPPRAYTPRQPFNAPPLIRLTLNPGEDRTPAWIPGGEIVYSAERRDRADRDRCLAVMQGSGGSIVRYVCRTTASNDSIDVFAEVAATDSGGGRIAYLRTAAYRLPVLPTFPDQQAIAAGPLDDASAVRDVQSLPYFAPSGRTHWSVSHLHWLDVTRLVYIGDSVAYPRACPSCPPDTVRTGLEIATLDIGPATAVVAIVPGTGGASSVAVGAGSDTIYFTRGNDAVVYRRALSSGVTDTMHDFGPGRVARDVAWAAGRLFVIVDGQPDIGGDLHVLGPAPGADTVLAPPFPGDFVRFQRPAPSADGRRVLVQGYLLAPDSTPRSSLDLWLYERP